MDTGVRIKGVLSIVLAWLLVAQLLPGQQPQPDPSSKQSISALPVNAHVLLQLKDGTSVRGQILNRTATGFTIKEKKGEPHDLVYDQVQSVSQIQPSHSKRKWIIIGVVAVAALAIIAVVGVHMAHNVSVRGF